MKILFIARHFTYFRNYDSVLRELAERGHTVHAVAERGETLGGQQLMQLLAGRYPGITYGDAPGRAADDRWAWAAGWLRLGIDYFRYQHPLFDDAPKLRERARERTSRLFVAISRLPIAGRALRGRMTALLRRCERAIPEDASVAAYLDTQQPDVVLMTPLIDLGSSQIDYLRAARRRGVPTALCVWSWDHLSSKALIRDCPDRVFVWNEIQKQEAVELHHVPAARVTVTGAQCFDQWFDRAPSRSREAFCAAVGLPAGKPFLLYVCSALFSGSPLESAFVVDWIRHLRAAAPARVRAASILVRPHPSRLQEWANVDLSEFPDVALWGANPVDDRSKADYFDSLHYGAAVIGLNTSAFIEAGIVGRPVYTMLLPEFHENQMGTLHFRYLRSAGGGLLNVATDLTEHTAQLEGALTGAAADRRAFVEAFVRPHGLDVAATPLFADEVGRLGSLVPAPVQRDALAPLWRQLLTRISDGRDHPWLERSLLSEREYESVARSREAHAGKARRREALVQQREERRRRGAEELANREAGQRARRERVLAERLAQRAAEMAEKERRRSERVAAKEAQLAAKRHAKDERRAAEGPRRADEAPRQTPSAATGPVEKR